MSSLFDLMIAVESKQLISVVRVGFEPTLSLPFN